MFRLTTLDYGRWMNTISSANGLIRGEGSITEQANGRFKALARLNGRNTYIGTFSSRQQAVTAVRMRRSGTHEPTSVTAPERTDEPTSIGRSDTVMTLRAWARLWLRKRKAIGMRSHPDLVRIWNHRVVSAPFYDKVLDEITPKDIRTWIEALLLQPTKKGTRPRTQTIRNVLNALRCCMKDAVLEDLCRSNPCREVKVRRQDNEGEIWTWLRKDEIDRIVALPKTDPCRNAIVFLIHTGLRSGEAWCLEWRDIDVVGRTMLVQRGFNGPTKTGRARRVPLNRAALEAIEAQRSLVEDGCPQVFPGPKGRRRFKSDTAELRRILKLAGIDRKMRLHDAGRHTFASALVQGFWGRQWSLLEVSYVLGHSTPATTARYAHLCSGGIHRAMSETDT